MKLDVRYRCSSVPWVVGVALGDCNVVCCHARTVTILKEGKQEKGWRGAEWRRRKKDTDNRRRREEDQETFTLVVCEVVYEYE